MKAVRSGPLIAEYVTLSWWNKGHKRNLGICPVLCYFAHVPHEHDVDSLLHCVTSSYKEFIWYHTQDDNTAAETK